MKSKQTFNSLVLAKLKQIPRGKVTTYAFLARAINRPRAARAVGNAVGKNPDAPRVPCHRVIRTDGRLGGYSGEGGRRGKEKLLKKEGIRVKRGRVENFKNILYTFNRHDH